MRSLILCLLAFGIAASGCGNTPVEEPNDQGITKDMAVLADLTVLTSNVDAAPPFDMVTHCHNGLPDEDESDVDCGGSCAPCKQFQHCNGASDCASRVCTAGQCLAPTCYDDVQNGSEPATDCGASCPLKCVDNSPCYGAADCMSKVCGVIRSQSPNYQCCPNSCGDGLMNGTETDVDCGGNSCPGCLTYGACRSDDDCDDNQCAKGSSAVCIKAHCSCS